MLYLRFQIQLLRAYKYFWDNFNWDQVKAMKSNENRMILLIKDIHYSPIQNMYDNGNIVHTQKKKKVTLNNSLIGIYK